MGWQEEAVELSAEKERFVESFRAEGVLYAECGLL